jgi:hypothetical protein
MPSILNTLAWTSFGALILLSLPFSQLLRPLHPMIGAAYTECRGCHRVFTHSGYACHMQTTRHILCCSTQAALQTLPTSQSIHYAATPLNSNGTRSDEDSMAMSIDNANHGEIWSAHVKFITKSCISDDEIYDNFSTVAIQDGANNPDFLANTDNPVDTDDLIDANDPVDTDSPDYLANANTLEALESTNHSAVAISEQHSPTTVSETLPMHETLDLDEVTIQSEIIDLDPQPPLIIDKFPFRHPGMLIEGSDSSSGNLNQVDPYGPLWAPFCSKPDWKFAQ